MFNIIITKTQAAMSNIQNFKVVRKLPIFAKKNIYLLNQMISLLYVVMSHITNAVAIFLPRQINPR